MTENLQEFALIAEIISAVAVVLSLLYVGYQIKESTLRAKLDSIRSMNQGYQQLAMNYVNNEFLGITWHKILGDEKLTDREVDMFGDNLYANLMLLEETWYAAEGGYVDKEFLNPKIALTQGQILRSQQVRERHDFMVARGLYTPKFVAWLDVQLKKSPLYKMPAPD